MPSGVKIFGSCNIWRPKDAQGEDFTSEYLTSSIYPIAIEEFFVSVAPNIQKLRIFHNINDELDTVPGIIGIELRDVVQIYDAPFEDLDVTPSIDVIDLVQLVIVYDHIPESLDIAPAINSIELLTIVIEYDHPPESMDVTPSIDSITLVTV